ncbi:hypothetical protein [Rothia sp. ZJ1223]|uniref:hypothetical protein n=1 Tax=Rothia sp. ZJ1223 TaxID=2811098 RepID=UPI00195A4CAD|nr:hypothetical protein [Rothia sp. ZJ1223]MBM7051882.1 hypothetical protein [Rothia sp. ZJ1223]
MPPYEQDAHTTKLRTFVPELRQLRDKQKRKMYEGRLGRVGVSQRSRYTLVAAAAGISLVAVIVASMLTPVVSAVVCLVAVALVAGGWPAATGIAELRETHRIYSHSTIILLAGITSVLFALTTPNDDRLATVPVVAAVGVVGSFLLELLRGEGARGRLESVISCVTGVLASVSAAGWVALSRMYNDGNSDTWTMMLIGLVFALVVGLLGTRIIAAGPQEGPRRGAITLGVTPVAFIGVLSYTSAIFLTYVLG